MLDLATLEGAMPRWHEARRGDHQATEVDVGVYALNRLLELGRLISVLNTARSVGAVRIAKGECQGWPPAVVRGCARRPSIAPSVNQIVKLPRRHRAASCAAEFTTLRFCFGMWWRRSAFSLKGKADIRDQ